MRLPIDLNLSMCNTSYMTATTATTATTTNTNTMKIKTTEKASFNDPAKTIVIRSVHFPQSGANTVNQSGKALTKWSKGLTVNVFQMKDKEAPHGFEIFTDDEEQYAEGYLGFDGKELEDYDGVFCLPNEVMNVLDALGFDTASIRESQKD